MEGIRKTESVEQERIKELQTEATAFWSRERKESEPHIKFKIAYGSHGGSKDLELLKDDFNTCDVYTPEIFGWGPDQLANAEQLSLGIITPKLLEKSSLKSDPRWKNNPYYGFITAQHKMIYQSKKPILLIDVPYNHELITQEIELSNMFDIKFLNSKNLEDKKKLVREIVTKAVALDKEREKYIFDHIPVRMKELFFRRPELLTKSEIKVLISLGAYHTILFHMMYKANPDMVERSFPKLPYKFGVELSTKRGIAFGLLKPEDLNEELVARLVMEYEFTEYFNNSINRIAEKEPLNEFFEKIDKYMSMFSPEEIIEFYKERKKGRNFRDLFLELLAKKGIKDKSL